ncbi:MAG: ATP-binding protein [Propionibacteriaceae bacterium]|nr:ATP-binding protein [Propionibacteriaceae bacterium]
MEYIPRSIEQTAKNTAGAFKVLLLTGARQVGKSTLLTHLFDKYRLVSFDDPIILAQAKQDPHLFFADNRPPLIIDEAQYAPDLFPYLKLAVDAQPDKGRYLLTGSQQFHMMRDVSETLAGRVGILELPPLSLREIQRIAHAAHFVPTETYLTSRSETARPIADLWSIIHRGCYPELQDPTVPWEIFFSSYVQTYLERDINHLDQVRDRLKFVQFLSALSARTAQLLNYANLAAELEISVNTVKNWVSLLEATGLVFILRPFSNSALNRAIKTPKLYFRDTGLACYLAGWSTPEAAQRGAMSGALFETYVVSEILKSFANEGLDYRLRVSYYRGKDKQRRGGETRKSEIDLIIEENGLLHPIEIKLTANPNAQMATAFEVLDQLPSERRGEGAIVCRYDRVLTLQEKVRTIPVWYL